MLVQLTVIQPYSIVYQILMTGGNTFPLYVEVNVGCSSSVVIQPPAGALYSDPIIFDQDTGEHEVMIG